MHWLVVTLSLWVQQAEPFIDVPSGHWAAPAVHSLRKAGIVAGTGGQEALGFDPEDLHGQTPEQILAMGRKKWFDFATRANSSNQNMALAEQTWTWVVVQHCDERFRVDPSERRRDASWVHHWLQVYREEMMEVGSILSGGGSMWLLTSASTSADVADLYRALLEPARIPLVPATTVQDVKREIGKIRATIRSRKAEINRRSKDPQGWLSAMQPTHVAMEILRYIEPSAKELGRKESSFIMHQAARLANLSHQR